MFERPLLEVLSRRMKEPRHFLQVLAGARQVGKTTLAGQLARRFGGDPVQSSADGPMPQDAAWLETQWERGRRQARKQGRRGALLILDEVQKIRGWSEVVKRLWDEDSSSGLPLRVLLLGSSALLVQKGLTESLAGRFELIRAPHWAFTEMRSAFGFSMDDYLYFGGYPGGAALIEEPERWARYIVDSLIETTVSRDVLLLNPVNKPHLLRRLFQLGCASSGQVLSYNKMLGTLQDAGNTTTLAHYLALLGAADLLIGLERYSGSHLRQRASSPKLQVLNTALMTAASGLSPAEARADGPWWGRLVESAVGAHLLNASAGSRLEVFYWRDRNREVDFVLREGKKLAILEVKSGRSREGLPGLDAFEKEHGRCRKLLLGERGIPLEEFLATAPGEWMGG